MASEHPLRIAYSGTLNGYDPEQQKGKSNWTSWFWTYKYDQVDDSTRTGYYFIKAVDLLNKNGSIRPGDLLVDWWGMIHPLNKRQVESYGLQDYFTIDGYISKQESLDRLASADLLFLPLEKARKKGHRTLFIPGKLYEYLKTGKPVLALCEPSDCRDILERSGLGLFARPDDPEHIAETLYDLITHPGKLKSLRPDINYVNSFSFREKTRELAEILHKLHQ